MTASSTGGTSGGPWLWGYSDTTRVGYVNGVASRAGDGTLWSPYFANFVWDSYRYADSR